MELRLGKMPVRVRPGFFVVSAILGSASGDVAAIVIWVAVCFVSVLFHELGHATVGRALGQTPSISLYEAGGLTSFAAGGRKLATWEHIAVLLAGPGAGFLLGAAVYLLSPRLLGDGTSVLRARLVRDLLFCNFGWGILNLLPILPLDGGQVARRVLLAVRPKAAERGSLVLSVLAAGGWAVWAIASRWWFGVMYAAWLGGPSVSALLRSRDERARGELMARCAEALGKGDGADAFAQAEALLAKSPDARGQAQALTLAGYALIELGRFDELDALLARTPEGFARDAWLEGVVLLDRWDEEEQARKCLHAGFQDWLATQTIASLEKAGRKAQAGRLLEAVKDRVEQPAR
jgi:Zn-dependent protease